MAQWPQWGGPNRNFTIKATGLAESWPPAGPPRLWERMLGDGYSAIVVDDGVLYTMYRKRMTDDREYTVALDALTGRTIWEQATRVPAKSIDRSEWGGNGPNATPLVAGSRLFTVGSNAVLQCRDKKSGALLWNHDLAAEFNATYSSAVNEGQPSSPIAYGSTIIVPVGHPRGVDSAKRQSLVAFDQEKGDVVWKSLDFVLQGSSPILITVDGREQLVLHCPSGVFAVDPKNGTPLWQLPERIEPVLATPVWNGSDALLLFAGFDEAGGRMVRLSIRDGHVVPTQVWSSRKVKIRMPTPVCLGSYAVGATDQNLLAFDVDTGSVRWVARGFPMAACIAAGDKLIILDENGKLSLATPTPEQLTVHAQTKVTTRYSFTVPTLVGTTLYLRDRVRIMALDLGTASPGN